MTDRSSDMASAGGGPGEEAAGCRERPVPETPAPEASDRAADGGAPRAPSEFYTYRLHRLSEQLSRQMHDELRARYGLKIAEWRTVAVLGEAGPLSLREVARRSSIDKAQVSRLLPGLIRRGYVARDGHPTDRRRASLHLTAAGQRLYADILVLGQRRQSWLVAGLGREERDIMIECLDRLLERVEAEPAGPFAESSKGRSAPPAGS